MSKCYDCDRVLPLKSECHFGKNVNNTYDKYPRNDLSNYHLLLILFFSFHHYPLLKIVFTVCLWDKKTFSSHHCSTHPLTQHPCDRPVPHSVIDIYIIHICKTYARKKFISTAWIKAQHKITGCNTNNKNPFIQAFQRMLTLVSPYFF